MASLRKTEIKATVTYIDCLEDKRSNLKDQKTKYLSFEVRNIYQIGSS